MKTTGFRLLQLGTPWRNLSYIIVETDEGITGIGEARVLGKTHTVAEYLKDVERHFIGHDPFDIESLYRRFTLLDFGKAGEVVHTGLAMVEMAFWDIIGKATNQPVYKLLGGKVQDKIQAYANGWYTVERNPDSFSLAASKVVSRGYKALKFDPFGNGDLELSRPELFKSLEIIEAVADTVTEDMQMMIEMHGRFAAHQAVEIAKKIESLNIGWIEEPVRPSDNPSLEKVRIQTSLPIATGERLYGASEFREIWSGNSVDIIQPDISQCGGIFETKKIASTAEIYSIMVAPHNVGGVISTLAAIHLCFTLRNVKILEHFNDFADPFVKEAADFYPEVKDGFFSLPEKPGWGVELNEEFILSHPPEKNDDGINLDPGLNMFEKMDWAKRGQSE